MLCARPSYSRRTMYSSALIAACAATASAQPASFFDLGAIAAPASPSSVVEYVELPRGLFDFGSGTEPGETLSVKWIRFDLTAPVSSPLFLDIDSRIYNGGDLFMAVYDNSGNLLASDDVDGSFPDNIGAGLSFGSSDERRPQNNPRLFGQDGATLPAGRYWFALAAGGANEVSANATNWDLTTTAAIPLGFFLPGTSYLELAFMVGNTTPLPRPPNDDCADALPIGENPDFGTPVWVGSNIGANNDGASPCYANIGEPSRQGKDVWFSYTPSASGIAIVEVDGGAGGAATPIVTRYSGGCGSAAVQCSGGGSIVFDDSTRISFPVTQGQPVLLALAIRAGDTGPLELSINLVPPPCELNVPAGAIAESEAICESSTNNGCNLNPPLYDTIAVGQTVRGFLFNNRTTRDTDWFQFTLARPSRVTVDFAAQYGSGIEIIGDPFQPGACSGPAVAFALASDFYRPCDPTSVEADLPAGEYRLVIANAYFDGVGCGTGYEGYWLRLSGDGVCVADVDDGSGAGVPDGGVTVEDLLYYLALYDSGALGADVDDGSGGGVPDGGVTIEDLLYYLQRYDAGC